MVIQLKRSIVVALAMFQSVLGGLIQKRHGAYTDAQILNYALTLEHLEDKFYREGLANFTQQNFAEAGYDQTFYQNFLETAFDEKTHVAFLTTTLQAAGAQAVKECTYNFGVSSVQSFVATAAILEGVGTSAYLGAAASIVSRTYLTAAGSILTVEARHNAYIRAVGLRQAPFAQSFGTPLNFDQVYTLASAFIVACPPDNPSLPLKAFPKLNLASSGPAITSGTTITVQTDIAKAQYDSLIQHQLYAAWANINGPIFVPAVPKGDGRSFDVTVPPKVHGQSFVLLTHSNEGFSDDVVVAGPLSVEVSGTDGFP